MAITVFFSLLGYFTFQHYQQKEIRKKRHKLLSTIPKGFKTFGIDVSHYQGEINWKRIFYKNEMDSVISFVYCKASEGEDLIDPKFEDHREQLLKLGKANGAYHYFTSANPINQAKNFLTVWEVQPLDLPPVLDVEVDISKKKTIAERNQELIAAMKEWLNHVEEKTGMRPIIYTNLFMYRSVFQNTFKDYHFWVAAYSQTPAELKDERILIWQYSDQGEVPGFPKSIDVNVSKIEY